MITEKKAEATKRPWIVYKGGNFIKIGTADFPEYVRTEGYLGGPFAVADVEDCATIDHEENRELALANAQLIVTAVNHHNELVELLQRTMTGRCQAESPMSPNYRNGERCGKCGECKTAELLAKIEAERKGKKR